jgi:molybdopterin converting factor small subunit
VKIDVEFLGLPMVSDVTGRKKLEVEIPGGTVKDVIEELARRYGKKVRYAFYDAEGNFDVMIQVAVNGEPSIHPGEHDIPLQEGDTLVFMLMLAGG